MWNFLDGFQLLITQESTLCHFHCAAASIQMHKNFKELGIFSWPWSARQNQFSPLPPWNISRCPLDCRSQQSCAWWTLNPLPAPMGTPRGWHTGCQQPLQEGGREQSEAGLTWFVLVRRPLSRALRAARVGVSAFALWDALGSVSHQLCLLLPVLLHGFHCLELWGLPLRLKPMAHFLLVRFKYFVPWRFLLLLRLERRQRQTFR